MAKLKLFASLREAAGTAEADVDAQTLELLVQKACHIYGKPFSDELLRSTVALNGTEITRDHFAETPLAPGDEVAILPPVSGGW